MRNNIFFTLKKKFCREILSKIIGSYLFNISKQANNYVNFRYQFNTNVHINALSCTALDIRIAATFSPVREGGISEEFDLKIFSIQILKRVIFLYYVTYKVANCVYSNSKIYKNPIDPPDPPPSSHKQNQILRPDNYSTIMLRMVLHTDRYCTQPQVGTAHRYSSQPQVGTDHRQVLHTDRYCTQIGTAHRQVLHIGRYWT